MRALRITGLEKDGRTLVCEVADADPAESFTLAVDDRFRAAGRGDLAQFGTDGADAEPALRPREIQTRIRAGATLESVAEAANIPIQKVERYAYPVLLERSRAAEIAQNAHPLRPDGPAVHTLVEVVTASFSARSQDIRDATWDAWRRDDGRWVAVLRWSTGHSDNKAHWRFQPGAHGGTVVALDDHAADLIDPDLTKPLRPVTPVVRLGESARRSPGARLEDTAAGTAEDTVDTDVADETPVEEPDTGADPVAEDATHDSPAPSAKPASKARNGRPNMPSWEDVLLGVRSQRG